MAKAVLISIRPEWVDKILSGEKTMEIRKTRPKLETPFKVYIYCTNPKNIMLWNARSYIYADDHSHNAFDRCWNGSVVAEFTCDKIDIIWGRGIPQNFDYCYLSLNEWGNDDIETEIRDIRESCIPKEKLNAYADKTPVLYAWHISDLKIYGKPKQLREFTRLEIKKFWVSEEQIARPPQSWCYVEELENG